MTVELTVCGHSPRVVWVCVRTAAGPAARNCELQGTEFFHGTRSPTWSRRMTTERAGIEKKHQWISQSIRQNEISAVEAVAHVAVWTEAWNLFVAKCHSTEDGTHHVTFGGVDRLWEALHGHPFDWQTDSFSDFLTIIIAAVDFLGQAKVSHTHPEVVTQPVDEKEFWTSAFKSPLSGVRSNYAMRALKLCLYFLPTHKHISTEALSRLYWNVKQLPSQMHAAVEY